MAILIKIKHDFNFFNTKLSLFFHCFGKFATMNRIIAIFLLTVFSVCNIVVCYGAYKNGVSSMIAMIEEDENHLEGLEVKKYLKSEINPFEMFEILEPETIMDTSVIEKKYEDVYLNSVESPPDFKH